MTLPGIGAVRRPAASSPCPAPCDASTRTIG